MKSSQEKELERKRKERRKIGKEYKDFVTRNPWFRFSKNEFYDGIENKEDMKARYEALQNGSYEDWELYTFIEQMRADDRHFSLFCPACFDMNDEKYAQKREMEKRVKELGSTPNRGRRGDNEWISLKHKLWKWEHYDCMDYSELAEMIRDSDSESWAIRYSPNYGFSMAIVYQIFKVRGWEPTPENEERLKYEILERDVMKYTKQRANRKEDGTHKKLKDSGYDTKMYKFVFPDIVRIFLGAFYKGVSEPFEQHDCLGIKASLGNMYSCCEGMYTVARKKGTEVFCVWTQDKPSELWKDFKKENLREILYRESNPVHLLDMFEKELKEHGVNPDNITYENVRLDESWSDYVFQKHIPYRMGGTPSPMIIDPPACVEGLVMRTKRLKGELESLEKEKGQDFCNRDASYLHKKREYLVTKLQVLLADIERANVVYNNTDKTDQANMAYIEDLWQMQLGRFAQEWGPANKELANEYIETKEIGTKKKKVYHAEFGTSLEEDVPRYAVGGWQSSPAAYQRKLAISNELKQVNKLLADLGEYSSLYNWNMPRWCADQEECNKAFEDRRFNKSTLEGDVNLLRIPEIGYDDWNDKARAQQDIEMELPDPYRTGVFRLNQEYLELEKKMTDDIEVGKNGRENVLQDAFLQNEAGKDLKKELEKYIESGITTETIKKLLTQMEEEQTEVQNEKE